MTLDSFLVGQSRICYEHTVIHSSRSLGWNSSQNQNRNLFPLLTDHIDNYINTSHTIVQPFPSLCDPFLSGGAFHVVQSPLFCGRMSPFLCTFAFFVEALCTVAKIDSYKSWFSRLHCLTRKCRKHYIQNSRKNLNQDKWQTSQGISRASEKPWSICELKKHCMSAMDQLKPPPRKLKSTDSIHNLLFETTM